MRNPIIVIAGPTASGKTALAIELAKKYRGEVINADSRSIYIGMDIGTSKPTAREMDSIPHHLFDIVHPNETFSLADYQKLAREKITEIQTRNNIPFIVGGSGLYIDAVVYNFNLTEATKDDETRKELEKLENKELLAKLQKLDKETYKKIDKNNRRRLIRALEVILLTNKGFYDQQKKSSSPNNVLYLALDCPKEVLYKKINNRIDAWFSNGLVEETKNLSAKYSFDLPSMSSIGYSEIAQYLNGKTSSTEASEIMKRRTKNYAKRQLTWFRRNKDITWIKSVKEADKVIASFIK